METTGGFGYAWTYHFTLIDGHVLHLLFGFVLNCMTWFSAWWISYALGYRSIPHRCLAAGTVWYAMITLPVILFGGWLRWFDLKVLAVSHLLIFIALLIRRLKSTQGFSILGGLTEKYRSLAPGHRVSLLVVLSVIGPIYAYLILLGLLFPPFSGDALMYHLPIAEAFLQQENLEAPALTSTWCNDVWAYYPSSGSVLAAWLKLSTGTDLLVDLMQLPFAMLGAVAVFSMARILRADLFFSLLGALGFLAVPVVINQCKTALVDVILAALVLDLVFFVIDSHFHSRRFNANALLGSLCIGLLLGVKPSAPVHLLIAGQIWIVYLILDAKLDYMQRLKRTGLWIAMTAVSVTLLSLFWYWRNWIQTGHSLYPLSVLPINSDDPLPYLLRNMRQLLVDQTFATTEHGPGGMNYASGLGAHVAAFAVPSLLFSMMRPVNWRSFCLALLAASGIVVWWYIVPRSFYDSGRYALPWFGVAFSFCAVLLTRVTVFRRAGTWLLVTSMVVSAVMSLPLLGSYHSILQIGDAVRQWRNSSTESSSFRGRGDLYVHDFRMGWDWMNDQSPSALGVVNLAFTYPFHGSVLNNRKVVPLGFEDEEQFLRKIDVNQLEYLAVGSIFPVSIPKFVPELRTGIQDGRRHLLMVRHYTTQSPDSVGLSLRKEYRLEDVPLARISLEYRWQCIAAATNQDAKCSGTAYLVANGGRVLHSFVAPDGVPSKGWAEEEYAKVEIDLDTTLPIRALSIVHSARPLRLLDTVIAVELVNMNFHTLNHGVIPVPMTQTDWVPLQATPEEILILSHPERFRMIRVFPDTTNRWRLSDQELDAMRIYEVIKDQSSADE